MKPTPTPSKQRSRPTIFKPTVRNASIAGFVPLQGIFEGFPTVHGRPLAVSKYAGYSTDVGVYWTSHTGGHLAEGATVVGTCGNAFTAGTVDQVAELTIARGLVR